MEEQNGKLYWTNTGKLLTEEEFIGLRDKKQTNFQHVGIGVTSTGDVIENGVVITKTPQYIEARKQRQAQSRAIDPFEYLKTHGDFRNAHPQTVARVASDQTALSDEEIQRRKDIEFDRETYDGIRPFFANRKPPENPVQIPFRQPAQKPNNAPRKPAHLTTKEKQDALKKAKAKSCPPKKSVIVRARDRFVKFLADFEWGIIKNILAFLLAAGISIGAWEAGNWIVNEVNDLNNNWKVEQAMAQLLVPPHSQKTPTLLNRNTHRTNDKQNFWYDNSKIAEEILLLPSEAFDAYMYSLYMDMGPYRENNYIDNWDEVIRYIALYADPELHSLAYARTEGCSTFEEYMVHNGWVDENGKPSVERFEEFGKYSINNFAAFLEREVAMHNGELPDERVQELNDEIMGGRK